MHHRLPFPFDLHTITIVHGSIAICPTTCCAGLCRLFGRKDGQVKLHGCRVELGEVEAVLSAAPGVQLSAAVLQDADTPSAALIAYVSPADVQQQAVLAACRARLPSYMVPTGVVPLAELPRLPNRKARIGGVLACSHRPSLWAHVPAFARGILVVQLPVVLSVSPSGCSSRSAECLSVLAVAG